MSKKVWIDVTTAPASKRKGLITFALERRFTHFIIEKSDLANTKRLGKFTVMVRDKNRLLINGKETGRVIVIKSRKDQSSVIALRNKTKMILVDTSNWKIIPLENMIAALQGSNTSLIATATLADAKIFLKTLEVGVDGVVIPVNTPDTITKAGHLIDEVEHEKLSIKYARLTKIEPAGMADRVCIDTATLMDTGEGMLIGSQSSCLFLIHSESFESEYVASRPFRVNAGAVHAYVLVRGQKTRYLSELKSGDTVLAVDSKGNTQDVTVGRVKIEKRPMMHLVAEHGNKRYTTLVQNAETIRLWVKEKKDRERAKSVVDLKPGDMVAVRIENVGRHFGQAIKETIIEK